MFSTKRLTIAMGLAVIASMLLSACGGGVQTVIVEGTPMIIEVTPTTPPVSTTSDDPTTLTVATIGEPETFDPAWAYETGGGEIIQNTYETLVFYDRQFGSEFIPQLATDWTISDDGATFTFTLREGVTFHNGDPLTAGDVVWSFIRGLLQGGGDSPQWMLAEPFFGIGVHDVTDLIADGAYADDAAGLIEYAAANPDEVLAPCEALYDQIVDNGDGTVSMTLAQSYGPFLAIIAQSWGSIQDEAWAVANGAWDGDCATWQNFYGVDAETTPLREIENGTGPFIVDHWTHGEEVVLVRYEDYWRTEPAWEGGPTGAAALERVVIRSINEWGTRFAMAQAGDADFFYVPRENAPQVDPLVGERCDYDAATQDFTCAPTDNPNGPLRLYYGHPNVARTDVFFTFEMNVEGGNPFTGSGELDGNGVPADFFSDIHVRRAMNYCFDFGTYINETLLGEAEQNRGPIIPGMLGYNPDGPMYEYSLENCRAELEQAWDGAVVENGFRIQMGFNTGNTTRQTICEILQAGFLDPVVDPDEGGIFSIECVGLPWPTYLSTLRASRLPMFTVGWLEDYHDPHNWVQPMMVGTYARRQRLPQDIFDQFKVLVDAGVAETDPAAREEIYFQLGQLDYDYVIGIRGAIPVGRRYEQRWVNGYYYNPIYPGFYFYPLSKD